ncbi:hypothetical protein M5D96_006028, partial [Drosophila gunungcola]
GTEFGLSCEDVACQSGQKCIVSRLPCNGPDQREGEQCGFYTECQTGQLASDFSIDTTLTIANTRSNIITPSTSTSTSMNRNRTYRDNDFELLTDFSNLDKLGTHAGQRQANVLVIVQDGSQQPQQQKPSPWLNRGQSPPCAFSPIYPYSCNYPGYAPTSGLCTAFDERRKCHISLWECQLHRHLGIHHVRFQCSSRDKLSLNM